MTVIQEEEMEDSILHSNFNSQMAANVTGNSLNVKSRQIYREATSNSFRNSDLSAVMEEHTS
jgi:hypothetical protein